MLASLHPSMKLKDIKSDIWSLQLQVWFVLWFCREAPLETTQTQDQHACDTIMSAASCVTCIGTANCGSDPACADCPTNQLESIVKVKKLVAAGSTEDKEVDLKEALTGTLRSAGCYESQSLMKTCGTQCYSSGDQASCSAKCLKGKGVQSSCASCLGRKIQCTVKNCLNFCAANANSPTCSSCVSRSCGSCNSEKSLTQPEEESFVTALVALSQKDAQDALLRSAGCRESQALMKTCGTQCYSSGDQASCSAKCLKGKGVQSSCASCLGRKIQCTVKNCLNFCAADANSPTCSSCVSRSCGSCNSEKSLTQPEEESFVTALVALSQKDAQDAVLRTEWFGRRRRAGCRESQALMKTCGTQCYSSGGLASCSAKCLKGKGVQSSCASCLGRKIQCTVKNCSNFCGADANSTTCSSCVSRFCGSCNSENSLTQPEQESFKTALVALSQKDAQNAVSRSAGCHESQSLMKTCGTQCYSSGDQASCSAKCLKGKGVQSSCASCLGRKIQCTVKNCLNFCAADANSPTCSSCVSRFCGSCNSEKSLTQPEEESFVTALVALSQKDAQDAVLRSAGCRESQSLMKTCGTQCYSSGDQASCSAKCLKGKGVQSSCASCLGRKIQCTAKNCLNFCAADANSPTCSSCVSRSCGSCNSEKSLTQPEEESFVTALVALSQKDAQDAVLRSAGCRESQSLMKTCGTQCYSSGDQALAQPSASRVREFSLPVQAAWAGRSSAPSRIA